MYSLHSIKSLYCRWLYLLAITGLLMTVLFVSCRKEPRDTVPPVITITAPSGGQTFYYQNIISIQANVTDDSRLDDITVEITNTDNSRVLQSHNITPTSKEQSIQVSIVHDDLYLPSGDYTIKVKAFDGENTGYAFQEIRIVEAPRLLERIFIVHPNGASTSIDSLHNGTLIPWLNFDGDYAFGGIDSRNNQLVACSTNPAQLSSLTYPDLEMLQAAFPNGQNELTAFYHDRRAHQFIWGNSSGELFVTDRSGSRQFSNVDASDRITQITATNSVIIAISASTSSTTNYIDVYPRNSGMPQLTLSVDWDIVGAITLQSDEQFIILAGNNNGAGTFAYLNLNTGAINTNFNFYDTSSVSSVCAGDGDDFYAIQASGIVRYVNNFSSYATNNTHHPEKIIYDDLNHALWAIDASGIHQLNESITQETGQLTVSGARDLWLKYNK